MTETPKVFDPELGEIDVYREYKHNKDEVEYTVYFYKGIERCRTDFSVSSSELDSLYNPHTDLEGYVRQKMLDQINIGNYTVVNQRIAEPVDNLKDVNKMREVPRDNQWQESPERLEYSEPVEGELLSSKPSETELVIVALLMRLYDVNMALLNHFDSETADRIYDTHNNGGTFNPQIFIPDAEQKGEESTGV